jgi:AcrR family transcriptional regulator
VHSERIMANRNNVIPVDSAAVDTTEAPITVAATATAMAMGMGAMVTGVAVTTRCKAQSTIPDRETRGSTSAGESSLAGQERFRDNESMVSTRALLVVSAASSPHSSLTSSEGRHRVIAQAGFDQIAAAGFEGLRMRDVAARAGMNISTVHYYVTSKESLIREIVQLAMQRLRERLPCSGEVDERLRAHLRAISTILVSDPALRQVLGEVGMRAHRDPELAAILEEIRWEWHDMLEALIRGLPDLEARGLEPAVAVALITLTLRGICLPPVDETEVDAVIGQLERWLFGVR